MGRSGRAHQLVIVVAAAENGVIGIDGGLPWRLPDDLKHFRELTLGHSVIMGRTTFDEIIRTMGKPLPKRRSIVMTRDRSWGQHRFDDASTVADAPHHHGVVVAHSLDEALALTEAEDIAFIVGGQQIYEQAMPVADRIEITRVHAHIEGDATFPMIDPRSWERTWHRHHPADDRHAHAFTFERWTRLPD